MLSGALTTLLEKDPRYIVYILPSYTDTSASQILFDELFKKFSTRIQIMSQSPRPSPLFVTALIDQSDILITGDTGTMHLAAAKKVLAAPTSEDPRNNTRIIAIFGGTNPGLYGYSRHSRIIGRGRDDQKHLRPGFLKEGYNPKDRNYFTHISPLELTTAIEVSRA